MNEKKEARRRKGVRPAGLTDRNKKAPTLSRRGRKADRAGRGLEPDHRFLDTMGVITVLILRVRQMIRVSLWNTLALLWKDKWG